MMSDDLNWGARELSERGVLWDDGESKNFTGSSLGSYGVHNALNSARGFRKVKTSNSIRDPFGLISPRGTWYERGKFCFMDPWGGSNNISDINSHGITTIACTEATIQPPEVLEMLNQNNISPDGVNYIYEKGIKVKKISVQPVWHLPSIAERYGLDVKILRESITKETAIDFTSENKDVFMPPVPANTIYIFGDTSNITSCLDTLRIHDECNSSDVFSSDMCSCRPYLVQSMYESTISAIGGGVGVVIYMRNEGRSIGEVLKFLIYNERKYVTSDTVANYFSSAERISGVTDIRDQNIAAELISWLGVTTVKNYISMSKYKKLALHDAGVSIECSQSLDVEKLPLNAQIEVRAKQLIGYE